jgi:hypothetical protein
MGAGWHFTAYCAATPGEDMAMTLYLIKNADITIDSRNHLFKFTAK